MTDPYEILAGWLIDGQGGAILRDVVIKVQGGLIVSINAAKVNDFKRPDIVDLSAHTLLPGLVDSHVHLFMSGTGDPKVRQRQLDAPFKDMREVIASHPEKHIAHGVIALRDGGDYAGHALNYKKKYLDSESAPIYLRCAGKAWRAPGRYGKLIGRPPANGDTLAKAIIKAEERIDHVKIVNSGLNSLTEFSKGTSPQFSLEELKAAYKAGQDRGIKTMVHANGKLPVKLAIEAGCDSIEHGFFMGKENLKKMAEKQIVWVPTAITMKAYSEYLDADSLEAQTAKENLEHQMDQIIFAEEQGVPIAVGTDCGSLGVHHGVSVGEEIRLLMDAGIPLEKAIQYASNNGARLLDLESECGRLSFGMPATFIAAKGRPKTIPESLRAPAMVFIRGKVWEREKKTWTFH